MMASCRIRCEEKCSYKSWWREGGGGDGMYRSMKRQLSLYRFSLPFQEIDQDKCIASARETWFGWLCHMAIF